MEVSSHALAAASRGRDPLRARRSSPTSRRTTSTSIPRWRTTSRPSACCSSPATARPRVRGRGHRQRRRRLRRAAGRGARGGGDRVTTFALHAEATYRAPRRADRSRRFAGSRSTRRTARSTALAAARRVQRLQRARRARRRPRTLGVSTTKTCVDARSPPPARCPDASRRSTRASRSRCSSTTPTRPTRWRTCCAPPAGSPSPGCGSFSAAAVTATAASEPQMGEIARRLADDVIVTSDNPRSEDPEAIIAEVLRGVWPRRPPTTPTARPPSPVRARRRGDPGDVVVIAGKGHEQGQEFAGGRRIPFDDVTVARAILRRAAATAAATQPGDRVRR